MTEVRFNMPKPGEPVVNNQFNYDVTFEDLSLNMACYNGDDDLYIEEVIDKKYDSSGKIPAKPLRFFKSYIDSKANIYNNFFIRVVDGDTGLIDIEELNYAIETCEKYAHISGQSIMYLKSVSEFVPIDASNYKKISKDHYIIKTDDANLIIKKNGVYVNQQNEDGDTIEVLLKATSVIPIIEFNVCNKLIRNSMVSLQYEFIADMSWAFYNSTPKLLTQLIVNSDAEEGLVKAHTKNLGRTTKAVKMGERDKISTIDMGDLQNLKDIVEVYNTVIKQMAVSQGVDKSSVDVMGLFEAGIAKIIEKNYINQIRKQYFRMFKKAEKQLWFALSKLFNISCEYKNIVFYPIKFTEQAMEEYVEPMTMSSIEYEEYKAADQVTTSESVEVVEPVEPVEPMKKVETEIEHIESNM